MFRITAKFLTVCVWILCSSMVYADDAAEVSKLLRAGQVDAASSRLEAALAAKPKDAQLRFLRGVIQIEQKRNNDAIVTFQKMTEDFPELPEPYNNLAVLYASQGQYDKARASLELAIRTHPSYATAHENMGDVYAKMASESYNKALSLDNNNSSAQVKLNLIKDLVGTKPAKPTPPEPVAAKSAPSKPVTIVAAANTKPAPAAAVAPPAAPAPVAKPVPAPTPAPVATEKSGSDQEQAVMNAVRAWALAWSNKDYDAYFGAYVKNYKPNEKTSHRDWMTERKDRIHQRKVIKVLIENPQVTIDGANATVRFKQNYRADDIHIQGNKVMSLTLVGNAWLISGEKATSN